MGVYQPIEYITKSQTLLPGEKFVLPEGAELISVIGEVDSENCDLPTPLTRTCYYAHLSASRVNRANFSTVVVRGVRINGEEIVFPEEAWFDLNVNTTVNRWGDRSVEFKNAIEKIGMSWLFDNIKTFFKANIYGVVLGNDALFMFKAPSSYMKHSSLLVLGNETGIGGNQLFFEFPFMNSAELLHEGLKEIFEDQYCITT